MVRAEEQTLKQQEAKMGNYKFQITQKAAKVDKPSKRQEAPPHPSPPPSVDCPVPPFDNKQMLQGFKIQ